MRNNNRGAANRIADEGQLGLVRLSSGEYVLHRELHTIRARSFSESIRAFPNITRVRPGPNTHDLRLYGPFKSPFENNRLITVHVSPYVNKTCPFYFNQF